MREREMSYDINTLLKYKIIHDNGIEKDENKKDSNYSILKDYISNNFSKNETTPPSFQIDNIKLRPPKYEFQKRMYISKDKHLKFHEKASIVKLEQSVGSEINCSQKSVNFLNLMAMFEEDEIKKFDFNELLNIDLEKNKFLKEKIGKIIQYIDESNCPDLQIKKNVLDTLNEKIQQINNNETSINNVIGNIENIDKIVYGNEGVRVVLQNK